MSGVEEEVQAPAPETQDVPAEPEPAPEPTAREQAASVAKRARSVRHLREQYTREAAQRAQEASARARESAEVARLRARIEEDDKDPLGALARRGVTADQITRQAVEDGSPEGQIKRALAEAAAARRAAEELQTRLESEERRRHQMAAAEAGRRRVAAEMRSNADRLEILTAEYGDEDELMRVFEFEANRRYERDGVVPDIEVVLDYLAKQADTRYQRVHSARAKRANPPPAPGGSEKKSPTAGGKTLTNATSSAEYSLPADFSDLPEKEQNRLLAEMLRSLRKG